MDDSGVRAAARGHDRSGLERLALGHLVGEGHGAGRRGRPAHLGVPPVRRQRPAGHAGPEPNETSSSSSTTTTDSPLTVPTLDGSAGYAVAASDGVARCIIPNGTVIPTRGHYLCVNSVGYSLASTRPATARPPRADATYTTDIPDNAGIALFNTATVANFSTATRLDAVGSTTEANTLYKEGTGYPALTPFRIDYSFYRDNCGKAGSITTLGPCPTGGSRRTRTTTPPTSSSSTRTARPRARASGSARRGRRTFRAPSSATLVPGRVTSTRRSAALQPAEPRPRLHVRPGEQLDLRHARHPPDGHEQHGRARHAAALPRHRPTTFPAPVGHRRPAPAHLDARRSSSITVDRTPAARRRHLHRCRGRRSSSRPRSPTAAASTRRSRPARSRWARRSPTARLDQRPVPARHPADRHLQVLHQRRGAAVTPLNRNRKSGTFRRPAFFFSAWSRN